MENKHNIKAGFKYLINGTEAVVHCVTGSLIDVSIGKWDEKEYVCLGGHNIRTVEEIADVRVSLGKKYTTQDGRKARILAVDIDDPRTVVAAVQTNTGGEMILRYYPDGTQYMSSADEDDLVEYVEPTYESDEVVEVLLDGQWLPMYYKERGSDNTYLIWGGGRSSKTARSADSYFRVSTSNVRKMK